MTMAGDRPGRIPFIEAINATIFAAAVLEACPHTERRFRPQHAKTAGVGRLGAITHAVNVCQQRLGALPWAWYNFEHS
jgi:hypothetical protein